MASGSAKLPIISVIIPVWGGDADAGPLLEEAVASVVDTVESSYEIIVVSNSEDQELRERIQRLNAVDRWCLNSHNAGVARGWNIGAQLALGEYLCFMNQDVVVGPGCIDMLVGVLAAHHTIGMAGPEGTLWEVTPLDTACGAPVGPSAGVVDCDAVSGFLFVLRADLYDLVGGFDRAYLPCLYEEIDMSFRVRQHGFRCVVLGGLDYEHPWGISKGNTWCRVSYLGREDRLRTIRDRNRRRFVARWGRESSSALDEQAVKAAPRAPSHSGRILADHIVGRLKDVWHDLHSLAKWVMGR